MACSGYYGLRSENLNSSVIALARAQARARARARARAITRLLKFSSGN